MGAALSTGGPSSQSEELFFSTFMRTFNQMKDRGNEVNVQREKRDIFTADIYYYITTELGYAKHDLRPAAYGVVLQRFKFIKVCMGKNGNPHYS